MGFYELRPNIVRRRTSSLQVLPPRGRIEPDEEHPADQLWILPLLPGPDDFTKHIFKFMITKESAARPSAPKISHALDCALKCYSSRPGKLCLNSVKF